MARGRKRKETLDAAGDGGVANGNGIKPEVMRELIADVEEAWDQLDKLRADYMNRCKAPRAAIAEIKASAKEQYGIGSKAFSSFLQDHADLRKIVKREKKRRAAADGLEAEVDQIRLAAGQLSETPFGEWLASQVS